MCFILNNCKTIFSSPDCELKFAEHVEKTVPLGGPVYELLYGQPGGSNIRLNQHFSDVIWSLDKQKISVKKSDIL